MRKLTLSSALFAVALALTAGFTGAARKWEPNVRGTVFVTERGLVPGSITAFDAATGRPIWTSRTGTTPIGVVKPRGTHKVYTSDEGSNQMSVFAEDTGALLKTIPMALGPHHLMATRDGKLIYVGEFLQSTVGVVDTSERHRDRALPGESARRTPGRTRSTSRGTARTSTPPTRVPTARRRATSHTSTPERGSCSATQTSASTRARSS